MKRDILYVDDELDNLVVFEATFDTSFHVYTANTAAKALELLERQSFPVVIADQRMPGMTGAELFEVMRRKYPQTRRVMLTGYADSKAMLDAINQGQVYYFLKKPWERHEIFSVLSRAIEAYDLAVTNSALTERLVAVDRCAALGRSAARIAHEMGNQLCMLPLLELIEERYSDHDDLMQTACLARQTYERLVELVDEVKSFVRFEQTGIELQPLALADVLHELVGFLRYDKTLPFHRLSLRIYAEVSVRGHAVKLQQVLINLIKNAAHAIRHRDDGQIVVDLDVRRSEAVIQVRDNGSGMSQEVAERIWEPFFTTKGEEGNGLGLDIVKGIIETHGGHIECQTAPAAGTTFTIRLPMHGVERNLSADGHNGAPAAPLSYPPLGQFGIAPVPLGT
ncbi:MAG TPA: hybrid sensor histidine kinase/response regulator [Pirellulales bacterium]|nr:hybrid sensor histidine kinase/response regulator [Pirellulales bacterium]